MTQIPEERREGRAGTREQEVQCPVAENYLASSAKVCVGGTSPPLSTESQVIHFHWCTVFNVGILCCVQMDVYFKCWVTVSNNAVEKVRLWVSC